jgi:GR25 family glycosyltransferase involved in LPS biosynthesis
MKNTFNGFGPIYVINLKKRKDRLDNILKEFKKHNIKDYEIFEAVDGEDESIQDQIICEKLEISNKELACTLSHINVIKYWYETSNSDYAIIMEDDISFETVQYWPFTWKEFLAKIKENYNMLQLSLMNIRPINKSLHLREAQDSSALCYLITRERAAEIIKNHIKDEKILIPSSRVYSVADTLVYTMAMCYSFPLFVDNQSTKSDISDDRDINTEFVHKKSKEEILEFWKTKPKNIYKKLQGDKNG